MTPTYTYWVAGRLYATTPTPSPATFHAASQLGIPSVTITRN